MPKTVCIICYKEKPGLEVKNDYVLESMRWFKRNITRNEKANRLVVCKECYKDWKKVRDRYVRRQILYLSLGIAFAAFIIVFSHDKFLALLGGIGVIIFIYLLSLITYMPDIILPTKIKAKVG